MFKRPAQPSGFDADDRIGLRIKGLGSVENAGGDDIAFDAVAPPGQRFRHDELEEAANPIRRDKLAASQHTIQLAADGVRSYTVCLVAQGRLPFPCFSTGRLSANR